MATSAIFLKLRAIGQLQAPHFALAAIGSSVGVGGASSGSSVSGRQVVVPVTQKVACAPILPALIDSFTCSVEKGPVVAPLSWTYHSCMADLSISRGSAPVNRPESLAGRAWFVNPRAARFEGEMLRIARNLWLADHVRISNVWMLEEDSRRFLIDTGHPVERPTLRLELWRAGVRKKGDLAGVILTHRHSDHAGNARWLRERFQCPVIC